ncbi:unnamed protein product [Polarella glacialis]|uniref:Smr domain-containing protein n=1 Tax=Polarella glacialis TaxID=89957 RepID=A0A813FZW9_POLGL|nr:unnamed protein product [Polarella glacialis]
MRLRHGSLRRVSRAQRRWPPLFAESPTWQSGSRQAAFQAPGGSAVGQSGGLLGEEAGNEPHKPGWPTFSSGSSQALLSPPDLPPLSRDARRSLFGRLHTDLRSGRTAPAEVLRVVLELQRRDLLRDPRDWVVSISSLGRVSFWQEALQLLGDMACTEAGVTLFAFNATISASEKGHQWEVALALLCEVQRLDLGPDIVTCNAAISACDKGKQWQRSLSLLADVKSSHLLAPNVVSYSAAISACERGRAWEQAFEVFKQMRCGRIAGDDVAFNAAISSCDRGACWQQALALLHEMRTAGLRRSLPTYGSTASACGSALQWQVAISLLRELRSEGLSPGLIMMNTCINACRKAERLHLALSLFQEMQSLQLKPDVLNYTSLISACAPSQEWQLALALHQDLRRAMAPDVVSYNAVLSVCREASRWEEALVALHDLHQGGLLPTVPTFKALIGACAYAEQWSKALALLQDLVRKTPWNGSADRDLDDMLLQHGIVTRACHEAGQEDLARHLLEEARRRAAARSRPEGFRGAVDFGLPPEWLSVLHWESALADFESMQQEWSDASTSGPVGNDSRARWTWRTGLVAVLLEARRENEALSMLLDAQDAGELNLWCDKERGVLDLHNLGSCSADVAVAAVRATLLLLGRNCSYRLSSGQDLIIVTGRGGHSVHGVSVVKPAVQSLLLDELGLHVAEVPQNPGRLRVSSGSLHALWQGRQKPPRY